MRQSLERRLAALAALMMLTLPAQAAEGWRVVDGNGLVAPWGESLRVGNVDTPEVGTRCKCRAECELGARATAFTREGVSRAGIVALTPYREPGRRFSAYGQSGPLDQFKRSLVLVSLDGRDLSALLISAHLARPWEGKRRSWCLP